MGRKIGRTDRFSSQHVIIMLALVLLCPGAFSQEAWEPYSEASTHPHTVRNLYMDCGTDDCDQFFRNIELYANLEVLYMVEVSNGTFPSGLGKLHVLRSITLANIPDLDLDGFFGTIGNLPALTELTFDNCGVQFIPHSVKKVSGLQRLRITNDDHFEVARSIRSLARLPDLTELYIPVNNLTNLPENIKLLKNIELLDLSDNSLVDLPDAIGELDSLHSIMLERNVFINPTKTFEKLRGLNIKYLSIEENLSVPEIEKLKKIFPGANIVVIEDTMSASDNDTVSLDQTELPDSNFNWREIMYGAFYVGEAPFKALSDAYLHYAGIFDSPLYKYKYDTLLFDERYRDTSYANVYRIQKGRVYNNFGVTVFNGAPKGELWFDFHEEKKGITDPNLYVAKNNREVFAFLGMKWVYQGPLSKKDFIREYIKPKHSRKIYYNDLRIYFDESAKNFTIELKSSRGFVEITAYPRFKNTDISTEKAQDVFVSRYTNYQRVLDRRKKTFHKRLFKNKIRYDITLQRSIDQAWESFSRMYMSKPERMMTRGQWMQYYDMVLADEKKALHNATPRATLVERDLIIHGYKSYRPTKIENASATLIPVEALFMDQDSSRVAAVQVMVINKDTRSITIFNGSSELKAVSLLLENSPDLVIFAELRNGDAGIVKSDILASIDWSIHSQFMFKLDRISNTLSTVGQVVEMLGL